MYKIISPFFLAYFLLIGGLFNYSLVFAKEETEYRFERLWPRLDSPSLGFPDGLAVSPDGDVYVIDAGNYQIQQFTKSGEFIRKWGTEGVGGNGEFMFPDSIEVGPNGDVYVLDLSEIQQFTAQGSFIRRWGQNVLGNGAGTSINLIAVAPSGNLYTVTSADKILRFTADGIFIRQWEAIGVKSIDIAPNGNIYVITEGDNIQQFTDQGDLIRQWKAGEYAGHIAVSPDGSVYVGYSIFGSDGYRIKKFTAKGQFIRELEEKNQLFHDDLRGVAISAKGEIYTAVAEMQIELKEPKEQIHRFTAEGEFIQQWGRSVRGAGSGLFGAPIKIDVSFNGTVYVLDMLNNLVQQFKTSGEFIRQWGTPVLSFYSDMIVTPNGNVLILANNEVWHYSAAGKYLGAMHRDLDSWGSSMAVASDGSLYTLTLSSSDSVFIRHFTIQGNFIEEWKIEQLGDFNISFNPITTITIAPNNSVYFSIGDDVYHSSAKGKFIRRWDSRVGQDDVLRDMVIGLNGDVYVVGGRGGSPVRYFTAEGQFIGTIGNEGTGDSQFMSPRGITIAETGDLYIADTENYRIQKFSPTRKSTVASHPYKAIILAGGGKTIGGRPNHIWNGTKRVTRDAYKTLTRQGFKRHEEIKFLTAGNTQDDLDGNGQFDDYEAATKKSLRKAIVEWATDAEDVVIFLANHGGAGSFQVNNDEVLVGEELNSWINQLEQTIPGKVSIIIESCNSASFFEYLKKPNRYLFASAKADQPAVISNEGLTSFSYYFWSEVAKGARAKPAFTTARQGMSRIETDKGSQNAQADTDGNGIYNQKDLETLGEYCFGACNQTANQAPNIKPLKTGRQTLTGETTKDFSMTVSHLNPLKQGWALVQRPDDLHIDTSQPLNFKKVYLTCTENSRVESTCSGQYKNFDVKGEYRINFYAMDKNQDASFPETLIINQTQGKAVAPTQYDDQQAIVYLRDVVVNGRHLQAALRQEGNGFVAFAVNDAVKQYAPAAEFNAVTGKLEIPHAQVFGQVYKATFNYLGGLNFSLESASPQ